MQEMQKTLVRSLGQEDPLEQETATHSSLLACEIPSTEEPGGLQSRRSQRVKYERATERACARAHTHILSNSFRDYVCWQCFGQYTLLLFQLYLSTCVKAMLAPVVKLVIVHVSVYLLPLISRQYEVQLFMHFIHSVYMHIYLLIKCLVCLYTFIYSP